MIFYEYISEYNIVLDALDYAEITLWFIDIIILAIIGINFLRESKEVKNFKYVGLFFFFFIVGRFCRLYSRFSVGYEYGFFAFSGVLLNLAIGYTISTYIGLFFIYFFIEREMIKKTHYLFSMLVVVLTVLSLFNYFIPEIMIILIPLYVVTLLSFPCIFINIAVKGTGLVRKKAIIITIGMIIFILGVMFDIPEGASIWITVPGLPEFTKFGAPICQLSGAILIRKGFVKEE